MPRSSGGSITPPNRSSQPEQSYIGFIAVLLQVAVVNDPAALVAEVLHVPVEANHLVGAIQAGTELVEQQLGRKALLSLLTS